MRFQCQRDILMQGINTVERAVSIRDTNPLLAGIFIQAQAGQLRLVATDLEMGIECYIPAAVSEEGEIVLEGRVLSQVTRKLDGEEVSLQVGESGQVEISCGRANFKLNTMLAAEYPTLPEIRAESMWRIKQAEMWRMVRQTIFAAATEEARPFLTGVKVEVEDNEVRMIATDIYRLAFRKGQLLQPTSLSGEAIIPARAMQELMRLLSNSGDSEMEFIIADKQAVFQVGSSKVITRLIDGQFPDYRRALSKDDQQMMRINRTQLLAAIERASLISGRRGLSLVQLEGGMDTLSITAREAEIGQVNEEIPISGANGVQSAAFQTYYLMDVLRALDGEDVFMEIGDGVRQGCLRPVEDTNYTYVLMPVRVG